MAEPMTPGLFEWETPMTDVTTMDMEGQVARVARYNEETRKFVEESHKSAAEARKLNRDHELSVWQVGIAFLAVGAALTGAAAAVAVTVTKLMWP
jgi:hypothetical protein